MKQNELRKSVRKWVFWLLLASGLSVSQAQSDTFVGANLSLDFLQGSTFVGLGFHVGDYRLLGNVGLRGSFGIGLSPSGYFDLNGDLLLPLDSGTTIPYLGGGVGVSISGGTLFNIHALGGLEFKTSSNLGIFAEAAPSLYLDRGGSAFGLFIKFGGNYHF
jgi:hypothetical protein